MSDSCNPMDCSLPVSSVCGISQARILEVVAISFSRASSQPRDRTQVSCIAGRRFTVQRSPKSIGSLRKQESSRKTSTFALLTMTKPFNVWITTNCGKFFKRWEYQTSCAASWYAGQEATVRTGHGTTDWFQIGKGVRQGCILLPCLFNLYVEYIMRNAGLDEAQAGIKIAGRNVNNLRYADDTTLMAESKELKSFLMKVKEESKKLGLKLNMQKNKIMASSPITSWQIDGETVETVADFIFPWLQNHCRW